MTSFLNCNRLRQNSNVGNSTDSSAQPNPQPQIVKAEPQPFIAPQHKGNVYPENSIEGQLKEATERHHAREDFTDYSVDHAKQSIKHEINNSVHRAYNSFENWKNEEKKLLEYERNMERNFTHHLKGRIQQKTQELDAEKTVIANAIESVIKDIYQMREKIHNIHRLIAHYKTDKFIVDGVNQELHTAKARDDKVTGEYFFDHELHELQSEIARMKYLTLQKFDQIYAKEEDIAKAKHDHEKDKVHEHKKKDLKRFIADTKRVIADKVKYQLKYENALNDHFGRDLNRTIARELEPEGIQYVKAKVFKHAVDNRMKAHQQEKQEAQQKEAKNQAEHEEEPQKKRNLRRA